MSVGPHDYLLADDLSGALDAAAAFHHAGRQVRVVLSPHAWDEALAGELVAVTTETRNADPGVAASMVRQVIAAGQRREGRLVYKKIDSTLRGPVAAELRAMVQCLPGRRILFAPANPRAGRTVSAGVLYVNGVPVAETAFGRDPASPLQTSDIRKLLGEEVVGALEIPDTQTEEDLKEAVMRMAAVGSEWLGVGSGALARPIAAQWAKGRPATAKRAEIKVGPSPILMIGGSAHPLNREQSAELATQAGLANTEIDFSTPSSVVESVCKTLMSNGSAILSTTESRMAPGEALTAIVEASVGVIEKAGVRRIFATGGETACALCRRLGIHALRFHEELEAGLSLSVGETRAGAVLLAVKPGGFGDRQTWIKAYKALSAY